MKCPRCSAGITTPPDPGGFFTCAGCGARLRTMRSASAEKPLAPRPAPSLARPAPLANVSDTDFLLSHLTPDEPPLPTPLDEVHALASSDESPAPAPPEDGHPSETLPPGTPLPDIPRPAGRKPGEDTARVTPRLRAAAMAKAGEASGPTAASDTAVTLDRLLAEILAVQSTQAEIIELLRAPRPQAGPPSMSVEGSASFGFPDDEAPTAFGAANTFVTPATPVRTRRRKSVLLIDDDEGTCQAAVAALQTADVPVRAVTSGNAGLAAIAESKPDVIVMELAVGGEMGGKDVVNMIKATMEWVDIPIVLYTRLPIESQKEARTVHGADELILKAGGPDALVARVIAIFRKG